MTGRIFHLPRFLRFASRRSASAFGTRTSLRASRSNAANPFGFLLVAILASPVLADSHESRIVDCCQRAVRQPLADNLSERLKEPAEVALEPVIESERLFGHVPADVKRRDRNVSSLDGPLEKRPEVFEAVRVRVAIDVGYANGQPTGERG